MTEEETNEQIIYIHRRGGHEKETHTVNFQN